MDVDNEYLLNLISLKEVFGGFAHEIAQPLNALMIATQVLRLKVEQSTLPQEDADFLCKRLDLASTQVRRASQIVENLREFGRGRPTGRQDADLEEVLEEVRGLMGQQFVGRGIEVNWESQGSLPPVSVGPVVIRGMLVQALAFARDTVEAIGGWHDERSLSFRRLLRVRLSAHDGRPCFELSWERGELTERTYLVDPTGHAGLLVTQSTLSPNTGAMDITENSLTIVFAA